MFAPNQAMTENAAQDSQNGLRSATNDRSGGHGNGHNPQSTKGSRAPPTPSMFGGGLRQTFQQLGKSMTSLASGGNKPATNERQKYQPLGPLVGNHYLKKGGIEDQTLSPTEREKVWNQYILQLVEDAVLFIHHWIASSQSKDTAVTFATQALVASNKVLLRVALGSWLRTLTDLSWEPLWSVHGFSGVQAVMQQQFGFSEDEIDLIDSIAPTGVDPGEQISQDILSAKFDMNGLVRALAVEFYVKKNELSDRLLANIIRCILHIRTTTGGPFYKARLSCLDTEKCSIPELERAIRASYGNVHSITATPPTDHAKIPLWDPPRVQEFLRLHALPELPDYITGKDLLNVSDETLLWLHWTSNHVSRFRRCLSLYSTKDLEVLIEVEFYTVQAEQKCLQGIRERSLILPQFTIIHGEDVE